MLCLPSQFLPNHRHRAEDGTYIGDVVDYWEADGYQTVCDGGVC